MNIKSSLGVYCSHREDINGPIKEAVDISNNKEYLVWLEKSIINPDRFDFPTTIVIKIKMEDRYYKGTLLDVKRVSKVGENKILSENEHRPEKWIKIDRENYKDFESILYLTLPLIILYWNRIREY